MKCPNCFENNTHVLNSRTRQTTKEFYRRRECLSCGYRFTTKERYVPDELDKKLRENSEKPYNRT